MKNITITRLSDNGIETLGYMTGDFTTDTLERPWLNNQKSVSCIPTGTYTCRMAYMTDLREFHYQILDVPGRTGIFIHELNFYYQSEGCVGLGSLSGDINSDGQIDIINSRKTLAAFEQAMDNDDITLIITNNFNG